MTEETRETVRDWLEISRRDLAAARLLATDFAEVALYHCQQSAEKALKGLLAFHERPLVRTHDVGELLSRASTLEPQLLGLKTATAALTKYATLYRYPDSSSDEDEPEEGEVERAMAHAESVLKAVLALLPPEVLPDPIAEG